MAPIFCEYSSTIFYSRASTNFWSADYMAIILLKSATSNVYWLLILKISDFVDFVNIYNQVIIVNLISECDLINQSDYIQETYSHTVC